METRDIGNLDVILELADQDGLNPNDLNLALQEKRYAERLEKAKQEGRLYGVTAVPTFIFNGEHKIVGAQPIDVFREKLRMIQAE